MKIKFTPLAIAGLFAASLSCSIAFAQSSTNHFDLSQKSSIRFKSDEVTQQDMDLANKQYHDQMLLQNPKWDEQRSSYEQQIQDIIASGKIQPNPQNVLTIPVVVHVVYNTTAQNISVAQVTSQMTVLNQDFSRTNPDASQTPAPFANVAANTGIQFCLAQRDPAGNTTTGIERRQTTVTSFGTNNAVKFTSQGGLDIWDPTRYLNIWVCNLGQSLLGYGEFPTGSPSNTYGVVILHSGFGTTGTAQAPYNGGRTTTHEFSHCFNLYHIWGDDGTACTGTDYCADTPNQAGATTTCFTFPHTDACTPSGNGIMFENYMDYSYDNCLNLFTNNQSTRINAVFSTTPYNALATSNGCTPVNLVTNDAGVSSVTTPNGTICSGTFTPVVVLKNFGSNALTSCTINFFVDANTPTTYNWTGNLATNATTNVTLTALTTTGGAHTFTAKTSNPNGNSDNQTTNDQTVVNFTVSLAGTAIPYAYGFEPTTFIPTGWTLNNPDAGLTWVRTTTCFKTGVACAKMDNFNYNAVGQKDEMVIKPLNLTTQTNPSMTFQVAYTYYNQTNPAMLLTDSLHVYISTNCGATWTSIYYKGGVTLSTKVPTPDATTEFVPTANQWRQETVSLAPYATATNAIIMFRNVNDYGDQMYIDDINIQGSTGVVNYDLGSVISVFPNPTSGVVYLNMSLPTSENVQVRIYDVVGQTVATMKQNDVTTNSFSFDLSDKSNGVYFVEIRANDQTITRKVVISK